MNTDELSFHGEQHKRTLAEFQRQCLEHNSIRAISSCRAVEAYKIDYADSRVRLLSVVV